MLVAQIITGTVVLVTIRALFPVGSARPVTRVSGLAEIDEAIDAVAEGWKTGRMGKVDLTLIRLAVYEMKYDEDVPVGVAINEAVELAKKYGTDESPAFINGVLAKLV